jgi:hypothetical protein
MMNPSLLTIDRPSCGGACVREQQNLRRELLAPPARRRRQPQPSRTVCFGGVGALDVPSTAKFATQAVTGMAWCAAAFMAWKLKLQQVRAKSFLAIWLRRIPCPMSRPQQGLPLRWRSCFNPSSGSSAQTDPLPLFLRRTEPTTRTGRSAKRATGRDWWTAPSAPGGAMATEAVGHAATPVKRPAILAAVVARLCPSKRRFT